MLRIIAGKYRSRKIEAPPYEITRPTGDRMREATFSKIQAKLPGKIFLDLFSGSGANPIEAVSRNAMKAIAVEKNKIAFSILQDNVNKLGINNIDLYHTDALSFLKMKKGIKVDFIYLDPPFKDVELLNQVLETIIEFDFLSKNGMVIIETIENELLKIPDKYVVMNSKRDIKTYSNSKVMIFLHLNN
ncbi:16S rRNA (guanine(966)-N(2))-methyltransferase RsmD [Mycoplasmopsis agassizii]|uniref:16S rRNA (Guanine(966)-N(2))-methyltransferase RsmD n=1 Tax=Mycoplasmopsis agassizii TaxID=33922 RepID=A0ABX4H565_9BACT|nr:16S rRNA (guanine(966)-N(2))-methyltransferase RsmD [Mycoplasmopsis agassizii]PAF55036.1 16S rRNA (guanine(966)-N(2))-methyltransferase RsmD [Mycoplasmopsis agassizii]SMC17462.1 16S rRNA (guanine966-N2)-methyltransferase [Mycoplasmopsis agassizii]